MALFTALLKVCADYADRGAEQATVKIIGGPSPKAKRRPQGILEGGVPIVFVQKDLRFVCVVFLCLNGVGQIIIIVRGRADIVEEFRDLELGCGFFFRC